MGKWKAAVKQALLQLLGPELLDCLILGRKEKEQHFSDFRHTPYIVVWERKKQSTHFNTCMPLEGYFDDWDSIIGADVPETSVHFSSFQKELQRMGILEGEGFWFYLWCCLGRA